MKVIKHIGIILLLCSSIAQAETKDKVLAELESKSIADNTENAVNIIDKNNSVTKYYQLKKKIANIAEQEQFDYDKRHILSKLKIKIGLAQQQYVCARDSMNSRSLDICANNYMKFLNNAVIKSKSSDMINTEFDIDKDFN